MRAPLLATAALALAATAAPAQSPRHNCSFCHDLHGGSYAALSNFPTSEALCQSCHGPAGPAFVDRDGVQVAVPKDVVIHNGLKHTSPTSCWACHDHEGEANGNLTLIPAQRTGAALGVTRAVVFTGFTGSKSFGDGDDIYDGVCEVCHTLTAQHRYDGSVTKHNAAADCRLCHTHAEGFKGGGRCTTCHNQAQGGRRPVVGEFGRVSHHVDWQAAGYLAADSIPGSDCERCHDQSQHQQGSVRLWNVDQPGNTAAAIVLTGDPNTVPAEAARLESFCLSCHDANGANGDLTPFSDGVTRPLIDPGAWAVASHSTASAISGGCYGDGATGCHATGHGSQKRNLLAPPASAAVAPALAEEEEGFCLACHRSGGISTKDMKSGYDTPTLWADAAVQLGPANLNDRHDVKYADQQTSSRKVECANCHDPHAANGSNPPFSQLRADPDPADGRVPGSGWFADSSGRATDAISEWCLDCHDGSWAPGVQDNGATKIVDILHGVYTGGTGTSWYANSHGAGPSGAGLKTGTNYWQLDDVVSCRACHQPHPDNTPQPVTTTQFNNLIQMRQRILGKDWVTSVPSDRPSPDQYNYEVTTLTARRNDLVNGYYLCNTCHTGSMGSGKSNCYECHTHADGRF